MADRARAMGELHRRSIDPKRLVLLWVTAAGFALGWAMVGAALQTFSEPLDPFSVLFAAVIGLIGLAGMVPTGMVIGFGIARDAKIRQRLHEWTSLDRDATQDARFTSPVLSLVWFLPSFLLCATGLWLCFAIPAGARRGEDTLAGVALLMGLGFIMWLTGLIGATKAVSHYRWAVRLVTGGAPAAPESQYASPGGAHR